ncbi:hypothetical protein BDR05DRAFT_975063 [Suillus weaverae]|nr:hypothetical protein BDR05DRAFT_975063 [Suillus weaverae]
MSRHLERENEIDDVLLQRDLINRCFQDWIRFDRYRWRLFIHTGLGWLSHLWIMELDPVRIECAVLAVWAGLIVGATIWPTLSEEDYLSILIEVLDLSLCTWGALYLEHVPQPHQCLNLLSVWWAVGQLIASLISWGFSCDPSIPSGQLPQVLEHIAKRNGRSITLKLEDLQVVSVSTSVRNAFFEISLSHVRTLFSSRRLTINTTLTIIIWVLIGIAYPLFNAYLPLYFSAQRAASSSSKRERDISQLCDHIRPWDPGSFIACAVVDYTRGIGRWLIGGRKLALAVSIMMTGLFLFLFTTSRTTAAVFGYSCTSSLTMYGVLYAYIPAPHRGTGDTFCSALNRIGRFIAPLIKISTTPIGGSTSAATANEYVVIASVFVMLMVAFVSCSPIFTAGKMAL